jgi:NAD-dependent SIR2 family protein deacetylase
MTAKRKRARVIEVNPEMTDISFIADFTILGKAGEVLPKFWG